MSDGQWALVNVGVAAVSILAIGVVMLLTVREAERDQRKSAAEMIERIKRS